MSATNSTKDKILQAAVKLLEENGIKAVTQPAVAKSVGIPQGQLTYHFPKRADLVLAVTNLSLDRVAEFLWKKIPNLPENSKTKIAPLIWELISNHSRIRALLGLVVEADENSEIRDLLSLQEARARALISAAIDFNPDSSEVTMAHAMMLGFGLLSFLRGAKQGNLHRDFLAAAELLNKNIRKQSALRNPKRKLKRKKSQ